MERASPGQSRQERAPWPPERQVPEPKPQALPVLAQLLAWASLAQPELRPLVQARPLPKRQLARPPPVWPERLLRALQLRPAQPEWRLGLEPESQPVHPIAHAATR